MLSLITLLMTPSNRSNKQQQFSDKPCQICVLQRTSDLSAVLLRALPIPSPPSEEIAFGHCLVCVHCVGSGTPSCFGWWPADFEGHDYAGDEGQLQLDHDEHWETASCLAVEDNVAESALSYIRDYPKKQTYQVLNAGGRSCLGFCSDVITNLGFGAFYPYWKLSPAGTFQIASPSSTWANTNNQLPKSFVPQLHYEHSFSK